MREIDNLIICEHLGCATPTIVYHKGECLKTESMYIADTVKAWRDKWYELSGEWIILALSDREYQAIRQSTLRSMKSVRELLYEQKVICINRKPIQDIVEPKKERI